MKSPPGEAGDFGIAHKAKAALFIPEKAKRTRTPKRLQHMIRFAFLEVGFVGGIVGVRITFHLDMSSDGNSAGQSQPYCVWLPLGVPHFTGETPIPPPVPLKVFLLNPA